MAASVQQQECSACGHPNPLPYLFCAECGAARLRLGRWRITTNVSLALAAMLGTFYFKDSLAWDWPLYLFFLVLLLQFMLMMAAGRAGLKLRILGWSGLFAAAGLTLWSLHHGDSLDLVIHALASAPEAAVATAREMPLVFFPVLLMVLTVLFLPAYMRWGRVYGWVNAYRLILLTWLALALALAGALRFADWAHVHGVAPALEPFLGDLVARNEFTLEAAKVAAIGLMRLFLLEVCIFAALQGYARARRTRPAGRLAAGAAGESVLVRSALALLMVLRQIGDTFELMVRYLMHTVRLLTVDLAQVLVAFLRELLGPAVAMTAIVWLLHALAVATREYIESNQVAPFVRALTAGAGVLLAALVFLWCKSRFALARLAACYVQLIGWLVPNLMVFFLILSLSLYATSRVLNGEAEETLLPFRLGLLTRVDAIALGVLLLVVFVRKRGLMEAPDEDHDGLKAGLPNRSDTDEDRLKAELPNRLNVAEGASAPERDPKPRRGLLGRARHRAQDATAAGETDDVIESAIGAPRRLMERASARAGAIVNQPEVRQRVAQAKASVHTLKGMIQGKPVVVMQLTRVREALEARQSELRAIEAMKPTLSPETFETLRHAAQGEVSALGAELEPLQASVNLRYLVALQEQEQLETRIAELGQRLAEFTRLQEAGILGKTTREQTAKLKVELEITQAKMEQCQRTIGWLLEETRLPGNHA